MPRGSYGPEERHLLETDAARVYSNAVAHGFLWPGFGENSRVLKWVVERIDGQAEAVETPIGHVPTPDSLDVEGLDMSREELEQALAVDVEEWKAEIPQITEWFEKFGENLPAVLWTELDGLRSRLGG